MLELKAMRITGQLPSSKFFRVQQGMYSTSGISDVLGVINGTFIAMEIKRPGLGPTALQQIFIDEVVACGGWATCVHSVQEAREFVLLAKAASYGR